jgi:hypothetical protein
MIRVFVRPIGVLRIASAICILVPLGGWPFITNDIALAQAPVPNSEWLAVRFATSFAVSSTQYQMAAPAAESRGWTAKSVEYSSGGSYDEQARHYWLRIRVASPHTEKFELNSKPSGPIAFETSLFVIATLLPGEFNGCDEVAWVDDPQKEPALVGNRLGQPWPIPQTYRCLHHARPPFTMAAYWAQPTKSFDLVGFQSEALRREAFYAAYFSFLDYANLLAHTENDMKALSTAIDALTARLDRMDTARTH